MRRPTMLACLLLLVSISGCSAVYAGVRLGGASSQVEAARRTNGEKANPYAYTRAVLYLAKAREEEAYGRYGAAGHFAELAEKAGVIAQRTGSAAEQDVEEASDEESDEGEEEDDDEAGDAPETE